MVFEEMMTESFPNLKKKTDIQVQGATERGAKKPKKEVRRGGQESYQQALGSREESSGILGTHFGTRK